MKNEEETLADFVAESSSTQEPVERRIERRLEILRDWLKNGIPAGKSCPTSLTKARTWNDNELKILPIASPNEFTTTHHVHGDSVREIGGLLTALKKRFDRPPSSYPKSRLVSVEKFDRKAFDKQLGAAVSQWQSERDKHLTEKRRADSYEARSILLLEENAQKDELIADLQRRLSAHEGLRTVK